MFFLVKVGAGEYTAVKKDRSSGEQPHSVLLSASVGCSLHANDLATDEKDGRCWPGKEKFFSVGNARLYRPMEYSAATSITSFAFSKKFPSLISSSL